MSVEGYLIGRPMSVRDALGTLATAYLVDGVESDHRLRLVRRAAPNDVLGDQRVSTLRPNADTAQADFTPSAGTDRFALVEDAPGPDGDGTYVASDTVGDRDLYTIGALGPEPAAINGVGLVVIAHKDDAGDRQLATVLQSGAATEVGAGTPLLTDYAAVEAFFGRDPDGGGAWAKAAVDALAVGFEVVG